MTEIILGNVIWDATPVWCRQGNKSKHPRIRVTLKHVTKEGIKEQFCFWIGNTGWKNIVEGMVLVLRDYNEMKHTSITSRNLSIVCHSCRRVVSLEEYMNNSGMCRDCAEKKKVETNGVWEAFGGDDKWKKLKNQ